MRSMTGFGRAEIRAEKGGFAVTAEVGGVNRKQLDLRVNLPNAWSALDPQVREQVARHISRGALNVRLFRGTDSEPADGVWHFNEALADRVLAQTQDWARRRNVPFNITLADLIALPGMGEGNAVSISKEETHRMVLEALEAALNAFDDARDREGAALKADFCRRLALLRTLLAELEEAVLKLNARIAERMRERLDQVKDTVQVEPDRFERELFFYLQKVDPTEEMVRLKSHISALENALDTPQCGRRIDFILLEMQREISTFGTKAAGCEVSPAVITFKTEIERMKEQVQNVE